MSEWNEDLNTLLVSNFTSIKDFIMYSLTNKQLYKWGHNITINSLNDGSCLSCSFKINELVANHDIDLLSFTNVRTLIDRRRIKTSNVEYPESVKVLIVNYKLAYRILKIVRLPKKLNRLIINGGDLSSLELIKKEYKGFNYNYPLFVADRVIPFVSCKRKGVFLDADIVEGYFDKCWITFSKSIHQHITTLVCTGLGMLKKNCLPSLKYLSIYDFNFIGFFPSLSILVLVSVDYRDIKHFINDKIRFPSLKELWLCSNSEKINHPMCKYYTGDFVCFNNGVPIFV